MRQPFRGTVHGDCRTLKVNIRPAQAADFTPTHTSEQTKLDNSRELRRGIYAVDRLKNKPLTDKMHECFGLLQQIQNKDVSGKLYLAICDAVDMAEDYAFDAGAELQSAISADELTSHEDGAEAHADTNTSTSEDTPNTIEYVQDARDFIAALSRKELKEFGHDEINGADQMIVALNAIEQLAKHDNAAAWECYGDFMESNLCGVSFKIES